MAHDVNVNLQPADSRRLEGLAWPAFGACLVAGIAGLVLAIIVAIIYQAMGHHGIQRLGFAYLMAFAFVMSFGVGSLFLVIITFLFRAGWVVVVRRPAEVVAASLPAMLVLVVPILIYVFAYNGGLYFWAQNHEDSHHGVHATVLEPHIDHDVHGTASLPHETTHLAHAGTPGPALVDPDKRIHEVAYMAQAKSGWLNVPFWTIRVLLYLSILSALGVWYWRTSTRQDLTGDPALTRRMEIFAAPGTILFGVTVSFFAFDLLMTLDPSWYSTMFGVYYFAGSMQASLAALILVLMLLQRCGFMPSVTRDHYHDLGKLMFAFVVFWAYIAFSQYMLIWYAAIPAEQPWMIIRGMSTHEGHETAWQAVALLLLFGRFLIPFFGLMSRHVKRNNGSLAFWAAWLIVMHFVDVFWVVLPEFTQGLYVPLPILEILCIIGVGGLFLAVATRIAARHSLVPVGDPRLKESLAFRNI